MNNFTTKDMSDMLYEDLSMIEDIEGVKTDVVLAQPTTDSVYPCRVIDVPLESTMLTQNAVPNSNGNLTGTKYNYLAQTQVKVLSHYNSSVDYVQCVKTGRKAYIESKYIK